MQAFGVEVVRDFHNHIKPVVTEDKEEMPEWISIYFLKKGDNSFRCNMCDATVQTTEKSVELLDHIKKSHAEVIELHKNPDSSVGFRIEFLQLNVLNEEEGDEKAQPVILGEVCEGPTEEVVAGEKAKLVSDSETSNVQYVLIPKKKKFRSDHETRKRSWVWKYFDKLSKIIFRCNICNVVLSIKGCNTNNMNRHIRTKHPKIYNTEVTSKGETLLDMGCEVDPPYAVKTEEITASEKDFDETSIFHVDKQKKAARRSWVWSYFAKLTSTQAQCRLCGRGITHGGNATGNMNRHIKMIHRDVYDTDHDPKLASRKPAARKGQAKTKTPRSWVWAYFSKLTGAHAQCRLCGRGIWHGGVTTGNLGRHIRAVHKEVYSSKEHNPKLADENDWVWKVFESDEDDFYSCKICQFKCMKFASMNKSVSCILKHLKAAHGVISGDQIITSVDCDDDH